MKAAGFDNSIHKTHEAYVAAFNIQHTGWKNNVDPMDVLNFDKYDAAYDWSNDSAPNED